MGSACRADDSDIARYAACDTCGVGDAMVQSSSRAATRRRVALTLGTVGVVAHNWWIVIYPLGWMPSWHALISEAEASDQPHSRLLSNIDIVVGVLVMAGLLLVWREFDGREPQLVEVLTNDRLAWTLGLGGGTP